MDSKRTGRRVSHTEEPWTKNRKALLFAFGMACFLASGLLVRFLPNSDPAETPPAAETQIQTEKAKAEKAERKPPTGTPQPAEPYTAQRGSGTQSGVSVMPLQPEPEPLDEDWVVYITGAVRKPGVYKLQPGARLFTLVKEAGGLSNFADPVAINMASILADGAHIHVPSKSEPAGSTPAQFETQLTAPGSRVSRSAIAPQGTQRTQKTQKISGKIDVNRASPEELTALKGIGPALARNIAEYRQRNGHFRSAEDLLQVKGIGEKKLEGFRDFITIGP